jgi:hypothetical protein
VAAPLPSPESREPLPITFLFVAHPSPQIGPDLRTGPGSRTALGLDKRLARLAKHLRQFAILNFSNLQFVLPQLRALRPVAFSRTPPVITLKATPVYTGPFLIYSKIEIFSASKRKIKTCERIRLEPRGRGWGLGR